MLTIFSNKDSKTLDIKKVYDLLKSSKEVSLKFLTPNLTGGIPSFTEPRITDVTFALTASYIIFTYKDYGKLSQVVVAETIKIDATDNTILYTNKGAIQIFYRK